MDTTQKPSETVYVRALVEYSIEFLLPEDSTLTVRAVD